MPSWPSIPPADGKIPGIRILRTPAKSSLRVTTFSHRITGAMTHYAGNRTQLCIGPDCPECEQHHEARWYGYLAVFDPRTFARRILEFPRGPYNEFRDYLTKFRDLLGARITAYRQPARTNGPVQIDIEPPDDNILKYPDEVDVFRLLCQMWKLNHIDQLRDYNESNLRKADQVAELPKDPPTLEPNNDRTKDVLAPYTRGMQRDLTLHAPKPNGSD